MSVHYHLCMLEFIHFVPWLEEWYTYSQHSHSRVSITAIYIPSQKVLEIIGTVEYTFRDSQTYPNQSIAPMMETGRPAIHLSH